MKTPTWLQHDWCPLAVFFRPEPPVQDAAGIFIVEMEKLRRRETALVAEANSLARQRMQLLVHLNDYLQRNLVSGQKESANG